MPSEFKSYKNRLLTHTFTKSAKTNCPLSKEKKITQLETYKILATPKRKDTQGERETLRIKETESLGHL